MGMYEYADDTTLVPSETSNRNIPTGYFATRGAIRSKKRGVDVYKRTKLGRLNQQIQDLQFQKKKVKQTAKLDKQRHAKSLWARRREKLLKQKLGLEPTGKLYKADIQYKTPKGAPGRYSQQNRQSALSGRERAYQTNFHQIAQPTDGNNMNTLSLQRPDSSEYNDSRPTSFGLSRTTKLSRRLGSVERLPRRVRDMKRVGPGERKLLT